LSDPVGSSGELVLSDEVGSSVKGESSGEVLSSGEADVPDELGSSEGTGKLDELGFWDEAESSGDAEFVLDEVGSPPGLEGALMPAAPPADVGTIDRSPPTERP
jgi:hypothetical protein